MTDSTHRTILKIDRAHRVRLHHYRRLSVWLHVASFLRTRFNQRQVTIAELRAEQRCDVTAPIAGLFRSLFAASIFALGGSKHSMVVIRGKALKYEFCS